MSQATTPGNTVELPDFSKINESLDDYNLPLVDQPMLVAIFEQLEKIGLEPRYSEAGTVVIELKSFGQTYARAHFVSAAELFYPMESVPEAQLYQSLLLNLNRKQNMWADSELRDARYLEKYVFVVDGSGITKEDKYAIFAMELEANNRFARKSLCTLDSMEEAISSPFSAVAHRANAEPKLYVSTASMGWGEPGAADFNATVTALFRPAAFATYQAEIEAQPNAHDIKELVRKLFQRIMGTHYTLVDGDGWPEVTQSFMDYSVPYFLLSSGEQTALCFCLYLALEHGLVTPGQCLGIRCSLDRIDDMKRIRALDCLRYFVIATGSSIYHCTDNSQSRVLTERIVKPAMDMVCSANEATQL